MKNGIFFTIVLVLFANLGFAQGDFAPIGAKWHYSLHINVDDRYSGYTIVESVKDTTIIGQVCRMLTNTTYSRPNNSTGSLDTFYDLPYYVYSNSDTVFYFEHVLERFIPLYIYNVNIGDTVYYRRPASHTYDPTDTIYRMQISNIRNVLYNGVVHRQYEQSNLDYEIEFKSYIPRVGGLRGSFIPFIRNSPAIYIDPEVRCYSDTVVSYRSLYYETCDFVEPPMSINDNGVSDWTVSIFPNPSNGNSFMQLQLQNMSTRAETKVALYDVLGRHITDIELRNQHGTLDVSRLTKGIYLIKISEGGTLFTKKIVLN